MGQLIHNIIYALLDCYEIIQDVTLLLLHLN